MAVACGKTLTRPYWRQVEGRRKYVWCTSLTRDYGIGLLADMNADTISTGKLVRAKSTSAWFPYETVK